MAAGIWLILPVLVRAVYTDIRTGKIENKLILTSFVLGLLFVYVTGGAAGVLAGLKMAAIMVAGLSVLFLIGGLGAGDIKLLAVIALFFPEQCIWIAAAAFIIAAIMAIFKMVCRMVIGEMIYIPGETIHFSIPILLGFGAVMIHNALKV